jgi:hypothetical protein
MTALAGQARPGTRRGGRAARLTAGRAQPFRLPPPTVLARTGRR